MIRFASRVGTLAILFLVLPSTSSPVAAESPTGRRTTNRDADLIAALIDAGRTDVAAAICQRRLSVSPSGSAAAAAWSIRLSAVRVAALQAAGNDEDAAWAAAREPVQPASGGDRAQSSAGAPADASSETTAPWVELQRLLVTLARSEQRAMRFLANPTDTALRDSLLEDLRAAVDGLRGLDGRLGEMIPLAGSGRLSGAAAAEDLIRLQQSVRRRIVQGLLLRADVYPPGSDDALAAATEAEQVAGSLLQADSADAAAREAAIRTWAETRRRAENPQAAVELLAEWVTTHGSAEPETLAQLVVAELQAGNREAAQQWLQSYYGSDPAAAPASTELDLARFRYLIDSDRETEADRQQISGWIEQIERRNGPYARRRAETEMLRVVRVRPGEGNATLMAARAGQLLRSGGELETLQAAQLLQAAAAAAGDTPEGFRWGLQSAAALVKLGRHDQASRRFADTATAAPTQPQAAAVHFEAARQWSQHLAARSPDSAESPAAAESLAHLETLLVEHLRRWPESPEAVPARQWLMKIYEASKRFDEAARVSLRLPPESLEWPAAIRQSGRLWRQAMAATDDAAARTAMGQQAISSWHSVPADHASRAADEANLIAALTLDREHLRQAWNDAASNELTGGIADDLRRLRLEGVDPKAIALTASELPEPAAVIELALRRLRDDAVQHPSDRQRMARGMLRLVEGTAAEGVDQHPLVAEALALSGQWQQAADRWEQIAAGPPRDPDALRRGAELLGSLDDPNANRRSIEMWSRLAGGLKQGTRPWHEAKLATATLLKKLGDAQEAAKLARFVLLTQPPEDETLRADYQRLAGGE